MPEEQRCWLRARRPAQKAARREAILEGAAELFEAGGYGAVSLNGLARHVGLAKSNLYRYFESKEQIFLELLEREQLEWFDSVAAALGELPAPAGPEVVAKTLATSLVVRPRLCALGSIVTAVLEQNVSVERIARYKEAILVAATPMLVRLTTLLPSLDVERATRVFTLGYALLAGLWPAAHPTEAVREVLDRPRFALLRTDFERDLVAGLTWLLRGAASQPG